MSPLSQLMQRYCFAYTACQDFSVADEIMEDDYTFYMGEHCFVGRDEAYKPATQRQLNAYPGLGFTVHDFISNGSRCAMYFSEHGHSLHHHSNVVWSGMSMYRWNEKRLTECRVEQDYYARRRQLNTQVPDVIDQPAYAPWTAPIKAANPENEQFVKKWLENGGLLKCKIGSLDDERLAQPISRVLFTQDTTTILDIMSAGNRVAFSARIDGNYASGLTRLDGHEGAKASLYSVGMTTLENGIISKVRAITDRYTMERRILASTKN